MGKNVQVGINLIGEERGIDIVGLFKLEVYYIGLNVRLRFRIIFVRKWGVIGGF